MFFCPQKVEKNTPKSCILIAVGSFFFSAAPTAQKSPELQIRFMDSCMQWSVVLYLGLYTTHELRSGYFCHSEARVQFSQGSFDCFSTFIWSEFLHGKIHKSFLVTYISVLWSAQNFKRHGCDVRYKNAMEVWFFLAIDTSIENKCFGGDWSILLKFSQFLDMIWCIFFHKNQSFCLRLFAKML